MTAMGCNCGGTSRKAGKTSYELTTPTGEKHVYDSVVEARMNRTRAGGGTIRTVRENASS
ncbi:DUF7196 family protein [Nocardia farcinica]|uniref:DUF7196 family protein n=1 Tax=Nocardia farcinica TaxID=37329 RepID=UPI0034433197